VDVAVLAALCMVVQDVVATIMVMAEAANRGWLAGVMDTVGWYFSITTTSISVTALQSHVVSEKVEVLLLVGLANLFGTKLGQVTGHRLLGSRWLVVRERPDGPRDEPDEKDQDRQQRARHWRRQASRENGRR